MKTPFFFFALQGSDYSQLNLSAIRQNLTGDPIKGAHQ
jgi:hypothetical protein